MITIRAVVKYANWYTFTFEVKRKGVNASHFYTFPNKKMKLKEGDKIIMEVRKNG